MRRRLCALPRDPANFPRGPDPRVFCRLLEYHRLGVDHMLRDRLLQVRKYGNRRYLAQYKVELTSTVQS